MFNSESIRMRFDPIAFRHPGGRSTAIAFFLLLFLAFNQQYAQANGQADMICSEDSCTMIRTYMDLEVTDTPTLLVVLHGDAPFNNPGYQYSFAKKASSRFANLVAVGMLRPGYTDNAGRTSDGIRGHAVGDNYDKPRVDQIADAIRQLKAWYKPVKIVIAGHSGGAALAANLIALHPGLVDHAFLVSCPCDVDAWRESMYRLTQIPVFKVAMQTTSPLTLVKSIPTTTRVTLIVGKDDATAPPKLSQRYATALEQAGLEVDSKQVGGGHEIFLDSAVMDELGSVLQQDCRQN